MKRAILAAAASAVIAGTLASCQATPINENEALGLEKRVANAIEEFKLMRPHLKEDFTNSAGYAVFPTVGKGAIGIGGAGGRGIVFERGEPIGYCSISQVIFGLALGGQTYREVIFFGEQNALDWFKVGSTNFAAQASAVASRAGTSADRNYAYDVKVVTLPTSGLMGEASIGGQTFRYVPMDSAVLMEVEAEDASATTPQP